MIVSRSAALPVLTFACAATFLVATVRAQHQATWQTGAWARDASFPGIDGSVQAVTAWDPDGPGPLGMQLVFGGDFKFAGTTPANNIAAYDPATETWSAFGDGTDSTVLSLLARPDGSLWVGGQFQYAGGVPVGAVARWHGTAFEPVSGGLSVTGLPFYFGAVAHTLAALPNGDVVVGGSFQQAGSVAAACIARWDGSRWSALGAGIPQLAVHDVVVLPDGSIVAGGNFTQAGGATVNGLARWDGSSWAPLSPAVTAPTMVEAMAVLPGGEIAVAGPFQDIGGIPAPGFAVWNGTAWSTFGGGPGFVPTSLSLDEHGALLASGNGGIARFEATGWMPLATHQGSGIAMFRSVVALPGGNVVAAGQFAAIGGCPVANAARFDGTSWLALSPGANGAINAAVAAPNGLTFVGGTFRRVADVAAEHVALWTGESWTPLGNGTDGPVTALALLANGDLVAAGSFTAAGATPASRIARWDGNAWHALSGGLSAVAGSAAVHALTVLPDGSLVAAGSFQLAGGTPCNGLACYRDGAWSALGLAPASIVTAAVATPSGDLLVAGTLGWAGKPVANRIARRHVGQWSAIGATFGGMVHALVEQPDGRVVAGGTFTSIGGGTANRLAHFVDGAWAPLTPGTNGRVRTLLLLPDGDMLAGGTFTAAAGYPATGIARCDGTTLWPLGDGVAHGAVHALCWRAGGEVLVGGSFKLAGGNPSAGLARLATESPAIVTTIGSGCPTHGPCTLSADPPWLGTSWTTQMNLECELAVLACITGFTTSRSGARTAACSLVVQPDVVCLAVAPGGVATMSSPLPDDPSLLGQQFHHQVVAAELDDTGSLVALHASNALTLTVGAF